MVGRDDKKGNEDREGIKEQEHRKQSTLQLLEYRDHEMNARRWTGHSAHAVDRKRRRR